MGNKVSGPAFPQDAVAAAAARALNVFGPLFIKAYAVQVARRLKAEHEASLAGTGAAALAASPAAAASGASPFARPLPPAYRLEAPPVAMEPLEKGYVTKLGEIKRNWKRRFFVATEEADGFVIYYFAKEADANDPAKAKGKIHPGGYLIRGPASEDEVKTYGGLSLIFEPLDLPKRVWALQFDSEDARRRWLLVLQYASLRCAPPLRSSDPLAVEAFADAYAQARKLLGLSGYYAIDRDEAAQLAVLATQVVVKDVLAPLYDAAAGAGSSGGGGASRSSSASSGSGLSSRRLVGAGEGSATGAGSAAVAGLSGVSSSEIAAVLEKVRATAASLASNVWPSLLARLECRKDAVITVGIASLSSLLTDVEAANAAMATLVAPHLRPAAEAASAGVLPTLLNALVMPLYRAHAEAIKILWDRCHAVIDAGLREADLRAFYLDVRCLEDALGPAFAHIRGVTRGGELDAAARGDAALTLLAAAGASVTPAALEAALGSGGIPVWEVEVALEHDLRQLVGWAIYTFVAAIERSRGGVTPVGCLHLVARAAVADAKTRHRWALINVAKRTLAEPVRRALVGVKEVQAALAGSVAYGAPGFVATAGAGPGGAGEGESGSASASSGGSAAAASTRVNRKAKAAAEAAIAGAPLAATFSDPAWCLEDAIEAGLESFVAPVVDAAVTVVGAKLDRQLAKLGIA